jgi:conjugal transfer/type IV secretion protein DotA/TraY
MAGFSNKANKFAQNSMRFLFAPELKSSFKPTGGLFVGFVKMVAEFLATAKLIPATHRALHPATARDARMGEVLALAYSNLRQPGARPDQYIIFAALVSLLGLITIMAVYTTATLLFGAAHAAALSLDVGPFTLNLWAEDGCSSGASTSLFTAPCNDMAQQWIDVLLLGVTDTWFARQIVSTPVSAGLEAMFATYSSAMLVLGGLLVLYHMLAIVAGTAQEGKLGGRSMNQIWAPIRLVMAIGLLVPIGYHGLNSGQVVVVNVAKWGSGLATNIWIAFANSYAANSGAFVIAPPTPKVFNSTKDALKILTCIQGLRAMQEEIADSEGAANVSFTPSDWVNLPGANMQMKSWDYKKGTADGSYSDIQSNICGLVTTLNPEYGTEVKFSQMLASVGSISVSYKLRQEIISVQRASIDELMAEDGTLNKLAKDIFWAVNSPNTGAVATTDFVFDFNDAVSEYRTALNTNIASAVVSSQIGDYQIVDDAIARGWMSASVWFNTIARYNAMVLDYSQEIAKVYPYPDKPATVFDASLINRIGLAISFIDQMVQDMPMLATSSSQTITEWAEVDSAMGSQSNTAMDIFFNMLTSNFKEVMGKMFSTAPEMSIDELSPLQFNTANPLAELSSVGHRMINAAMKIFSDMDKCVGSANGTEYSKDDKLNARIQSQQSNKCLTSGSFGGTYFMSAMLSAVIGAGVTLGYMLPLLPFIRFMFGILSWILALIETVIAIPVVALAHIKMDGEGLSGPMARGAYLLLLQLFLRPTLMIFGLISALLIFNFMIVVLNEFYTQAVAGATDSGKLGGTALVIYSVIYASLAYAFANASFKAIDMIPNQVLLWIGGPQGQTVDESHRVTGAVGQAAHVGGSGLSAHSLGQGGSHRYIQGASDDPAMKKQ